MGGTADAIPAGAGTLGKSDVSAPGGSTRNYTGVPGSEVPPGYGGQGRLIDVVVVPRFHG